MAKISQAPEPTMEELLRRWFPSYNGTGAAGLLVRWNWFAHHGQHGYRAIFDDKLNFAGVHSVPQPRTLWSVSGGWAYSTAGDRIPVSELASKLPRKYFVKPRSSAGGRGAFLVQRGIAVLTNGDQVQTPLEHFLATKLAKGNYIVQEVIEQASSYAAPSDTSINTVRVTTQYLGRQHSSVLGATWRVGTGHSVVDNATAGGLYVGIDLNSGKLLGAARGKRGERFERHPVTQFQFKGYTLPDFRDILETSMDAHRVVGNPPTVAWDVAMTSHGPVVVEGNTNWLTSLHTKVDKNFAKRALSGFYAGRGLPSGPGWEDRLLHGHRLDLSEVTVEVQIRRQEDKLARWLARLAEDKGVSCRIDQIPGAGLQICLGGMQWLIEHVIYSIFMSPKRQQVENVAVIDGKVRSYAS